MPEQARVTSLGALESFRSHLIVYLSQVRPLLEEVSAGVVRTRLWIENDQRTYWENQIRRRNKELQEAQQALFSARIGSLKQGTSAEQLLVQRAKRQVEDADSKLRVLKRWNRDYDGRVDPLVKHMEKLHTILSNDMVKAVVYLTQAIGTLAAYSEIKKETNAGGA
ncbi:MAG: hypothetical protein ACREIC_05555 [Limisphaerales bacterium]